MQSTLHRNLVPRCPAADLFGTKGRAWLAAQDLPADEQQAVGALLRQLDFHAVELRIVDTELGRVALQRAEVHRLLTIPGVDATVALTRGCASRAASRPSTAGSPSKAGRMPAACWWRPPGRGQDPGPLRAFYERPCARRGMQVAVVATARKLAMLCWHLVVGEQDYGVFATKRGGETSRRCGLASLRGDAAVQGKA